MKKIFLGIMLFGAVYAQAQQPQTRPAGTQTTAAPGGSPDQARPAGGGRTINPDQVVTTNHEVTIRGAKVPYKAMTGTMPVWDEDGKAVAGLFYTYYERSDVSNREARPLVISFNGGPGSASVWMHLAYTGPAVLKIYDEGYPIQPYGYNISYI